MAQHGGVGALCEAGLAYLSAGQLVEAERSFAGVVAREPRHLQGLLALGVIAWQQQRQPAALTYARKAAAIAPKLAAGHLLLARVLREGGRLADAITAFRAALRLAPADTAARFELAQVLADAALLDEAALCYRTALQGEPANAAGHYNLGNLLLRLGQPGAAVECYQSALVLQPANRHARNNLAAALRKGGRVEEAEQEYRALTEQCPDMVDAHNNLGTLLFEDGRFAEAVPCFQQALFLRPDHADAANNLGSALIELGDYAAAKQCLQGAVELGPLQALPRSNLGAALRELGDVAAAEACFRQAVRLAGDTVAARNNLATTLLQTGRLQEGWALYESRWETPTLPPRPFSQPLWQGETLGNQVLLLHAEQGMGDTLQFCRYVRLAAQRARVVLEVQPALRRLLARSLPDVEQIVARGEALPRFDRHCPLLSLPRLFGTVLETIPAEMPYLSPDPADGAVWQSRLAALPGRRVGLVWRGNQAFADAKRKRDLDPAYLAMLAGLPGVSFVSLQKDLDAERQAAVRDLLPMTDWTADLTDFAQTAALIAGLDLVIGVDTAVIHLAGALGRPVWLLNRFDPCWRWLREREDSPWYPTLRQFRQPAVGDWAGVLQRVHAALASVAPDAQPRGRHAFTVVARQCSSLCFGE